MALANVRHHKPSPTVANFEGETSHPVGSLRVLSVSSESFPAGPHVEPTAPGSSIDFWAVRAPGVLQTDGAPGSSNGSSLGGPAAQHSHPLSVALLGARHSLGGQERR